MLLRATDMDGRRAPCDVLCGAVAMALADALSVDLLRVEAAQAHCLVPCCCEPPTWMAGAAGGSEFTASYVSTCCE